jgi:heat shock protein HtpX
MASFFDEIGRNKIRSVLLMALFGAFFFLVILLFGVILTGSVAFGLFVAGILVIAYAAFTYFTGDKLVLKMSRAKAADKSQYHDLYDIVEGLAAAEQIPMPAVYIIDDPNPNAFATGRNKKHASIAVTTGLLGMMDKRELEGVLAHEASHVGNNDIQFMMVAIVFAGVIGLIAVFVRSMLFFGGIGGGNNRNNGGLLLLVALVLGLLAPLFAMLIRLAISRRREYMADANGARITRDPAALASALRNIQKYTARPAAKPVKSANEITAPLYFSNPLNMRSVSNLFSTHPPIEDRIQKLEHMY